MTETEYPLITAAGAPRELGRAHGEQAAEKIQAYLDYLCATLKLTRGDLRQRAARFQPLLAQHCPDLLQEIQGLAEGADLHRDEALALQIRGELGQTCDHACTTLAIGRDGTDNGEILIGQTSDTPPEIEQFAYVIHLKPLGQPALIMWTFGGMIGYHGLNAHGVAHFANSLGGGPSWKFAMPHYPLKRLILQCRNLKQIERLMRDLPVCSNGNYMLCDGGGKILDVELTTDGPSLTYDAGAGFLVHSNHFLCAPHACKKNLNKSLPDSVPRLERMRALIGEKFGSITVADVQSFFSDHSGHPTSICRHPHDGHGDTVLPANGKTVAAIIAEPGRGVLSVTRGNPCENPFVEYAL